MPLKPTVLSLRGHVFDECQELSHFLDLKSVGQSSGIALNPSKWDEALAKSICVRATQLLSTGQTATSDATRATTSEATSGPAQSACTLFLKFQHNNTGAETQLRPHKSCVGFEKRRGVAKERSQKWPSRFSFCVPGKWCVAASHLTSLLFSFCLLF
jgi:hypothetical protein